MKIVQPPLKPLSFPVAVITHFGRAFGSLTRNGCLNLDVRRKGESLNSRVKFFIKIILGRRGGEPPHLRLVAPAIMKAYIRLFWGWIKKLCLDERNRTTTAKRTRASLNVSLQLFLWYNRLLKLFISFFLFDVGCGPLFILGVLQHSQQIAGRYRAWSKQFRSTSPKKELTLELGEISAEKKTLYPDVSTKKDEESTRYMHIYCIYLVYILYSI